MVQTLPIIPLLAFQERSFGILLAGAQRTITAAVTLLTAGGGLLKDFSSVRFALFRVFRASSAAYVGVHVCVHQLVCMHACVKVHVFVQSIHVSQTVPPVHVR